MAGPKPRLHIMFRVLAARDVHVFWQLAPRYYQLRLDWRHDCTFCSLPQTGSGQGLPRLAVSVSRTALSLNGFTGKTRPDFSLENYRWMDALSMLPVWRSRTGYPIIQTQARNKHTPHTKGRSTLPSGTAHSTGNCGALCLRSGKSDYSASCDLISWRVSMTSPGLARSQL